jgi:putative membrane protein
MEKITEGQINKDLILREKLALQRTILANSSTFLAFLRTSLYFAIAGLSIENLIKVNNGHWFEIGFWLSAIIILIVGVVNYFMHRKKIKDSFKNIGDYKLEWEQKK